MVLAAVLSLGAALLTLRFTHDYVLLGGDSYSIVAASRIERRIWNFRACGV